MKYNVYTENLKILVFDIETTGLEPGKDIIISASFCYEDGSGLNQYFTDAPESEFLLIKKIEDELSTVDAVITYNGERFDLPFVRTRARFYGIEDKIAHLWNIDIYRYLKKYWEAGKFLPGLTQKNVEYALGLTDKRDDKIDGKECISLYNSYLLHKNEQDKEKILLHNADDVKQLAAVSESLSFLPFHKIIFEQGHHYVSRASFPGSQDVAFAVSNVFETDNGFYANIKTVSGLLPMSIFEEYYSVEYDSFSGSARIEIKTKELEDYQYVDLSKMPVNINDFIDLEGFASNYLILKQNKKILYKEVNKLIKELGLKIIL